MSFFQPSVLNKYLQQLDDKAVNAGYEQFKSFFFNSEIQKNIDEAKEEQMQENFLRELFGKVLGYTHFPLPSYNLSTEYKNETGSKKADGAILKDGKAIAVIELKGTNTPYLDRVEQQAFNYKNNQTGCEYVVISNFEKLRFFIHDAVSHIEFNLFNLTIDDFKLLWLCLHKDSIFKGIPEKIKQESISAEDKVTKQLYADYSKFKNELWQDLVKNNPALDKLLLYQKSQKLLDRFLFIYFSEDKGLLPPNSINEIIKQWEELKERDEYRPLYDRIKKYFGYMNQGWKGKTYEIFAYNGGLFQPDELLDKFIIGDEVLSRHMKQLSTYNFASEVDVNILGHIFEHSLSEIEAITAELESKEHDASKSKRKRDGVFYTPKYITKYIVENTVGKLCEEKKAAIGIAEEEFVKGRKYRKKETIKALDDKLKHYRKWLLEITICDPACGSGAFLNQALDFLIKEHHYIDELNALLLGGRIIFQDVENHILENNLYGVDINEESTEIARLSLWLRTAQKGRKLSSLNNNIRCGNSLIDDAAVAGDKAFNWQKEFPAVFAKSGFDVVIGNPPYGAVLKDEQKIFVQNKYICYSGNFDIYSAFIEKAFIITKANGLWSFINPVSWQSGENYFDLRNYISKNGTLEIAIKLPYDVFADAYVDTGIYIVRKQINKHYSTLVYDFPIRVKYSGDLVTDITLKKLPNSYWQNLPSLRIVLSPIFYEVLPKIFKDTISLNSISSSIRGILPNEQDVSVEIRPSDKRYFIGSLNRYTYTKEFAGVNYGEHLKEKPKDFGFFKGERLLVRRIISRQFRIMATYFNDEFVNKKDYYNLKITNEEYDIKYILAIIGSQLISFLKTRGSTTATKDDFAQLSLSDVREIPIKPIDLKSQQSFITKAETMLTLNKQLQEASQKFQRSIERKFELTELSNKLQEWYRLTYSEFIKELAKKKKKLSLSEEAEWETYFLQEQKKALDLKTEIDKTDKEIDKMVYELYGLTEEEINIVEK